MRSVHLSDSSTFVASPKSFSLLKGFCAIGLLACLPQLARAATINVGTASNAASWLITGAGATNAPAEQYGGAISITSDNFSDGTFITGGSVAAFDGFWEANNTFNLPADATNISLAWSFTDPGADDRAVVELNGNIIGDFFLLNNTFSPTPLTGPGYFSFTDSPVGAPAPRTGDPDNYTFTGIGSTPQLVVNPAFFNVGGPNVLTLIVNNAYAGPTPDNFTTEETAGFNPTGYMGDGTYVNLNGTVSFDSASLDAAPIPPAASSALILLAGAAAFAAARSRLHPQA